MALDARVTITKNLFALKGAEEGAKQGNIGVALAVHAQTVKNCPKEYAQLANSYMVKFDGGEEGFNTASNGPKGNIDAPDSQKLTERVKGNEVAVGTGSDHWHPEFGTKYQVAQPHFRPAKEQIVNGSTDIQIQKKYGAEAMREAFNKRKVKKETK